MAKLRLGMKAELIKRAEGTILSTGNKYYKLIIEQNGEVTSLPCNEAVYLLAEGKERSETNLVVEFNDEYKKLRVVDIAKGKGA